MNTVVIGFLSLCLLVFTGCEEKKISNSLEAAEVETTSNGLDSFSLETADGRSLNITFKNNEIVVDKLKNKMIVFYTYRPDKLRHSYNGDTLLQLSDIQNQMPDKLKVICLPFHNYPYNNSEFVKYLSINNKLKQTMILSSEINEKRIIDSLQKLGRGNSTGNYYIFNNGKFIQYFDLQTTDIKDVVLKINNILNSNITVELEPNTSSFKDIDGNIFLNELDKKLYNACVKQNTKAAKQLISEGANINLVDADGKTLIGYQIELYEINYPFIEFLIKQGIDINTKNKEGKRVLDICCLSEEKKKYLISKGAH